MLQRITAEEFETISGVAISEKLDQAYILENVLPRLVPVSEIRDGAVWAGWNDVAIEYVVPVGDDDDGGSYTMVISRDLLGRLELEHDQVHAAAVRNVEQAAKITTLGAIMADLTGCELTPDALAAPPVVVVTTENGTYGAAAILAPAVREEIKARLGGSYLLIPSSRHELLAMRAGDMPPSEILRMNSSVNESEIINDSDYLATNVYSCNGGEVTALY